MKNITICNKEYQIASNALTRFQYKKIFGKGIFTDIKILNDFSLKEEALRQKLKEEKKTKKEIETEITMYMMENLDDFIDVIERIAYILIYTANNNIGSFEEWLSGIDKIDLSAPWISEVTELAVNSFC